jgi:hypothetical protein
MPSELAARDFCPTCSAEPSVTFLRFAITVEPDGGPVCLELTGPRGTREFVAALRLQRPANDR